MKPEPMKKTFLFSVILFFAGSSLCLGQNLKLEYDSSRAHIQKNDFAGALPWLEKAKVSAKLNVKDTNSYVEIVKLMAVCYAKIGNVADAEMAFKEAIDLYSKMPSKKAQYASTLQNFGIFYFNQKKYKEAEPVLVKAEQVKRESGSEKNSDYISILNYAANLERLALPQVATIAAAARTVLGRS